MTVQTPISYRDAGVDTEYANNSVSRIKKSIQKTRRPGLMNGIGGFAGLFSLKDMQKAYTDPVLVSGTDGVGTKLLVAIAANKPGTIGQDLVAMCANDVLCQGAKPLFFLDYFAASSLTQTPLEQIVESIASACDQIDCVLIGGESAEMPGMYANKHYDLAGFTVGVVERNQIVDGSQIKPGDMIIGLASNGLHANGFSLVRKIVFEKNKLALNDTLTFDEDNKQSVQDLLLKPTKLYVKSILGLIETQTPINGMAHITGGGLTENIQRQFPKTLSAVIDEKTWNVPPIFEYLERSGPVTKDEMRKTFNLGIGFTIIVNPDDAKTATEFLNKNGESAQVIGHVQEKEGPVTFI